MTFSEKNCIIGNVRDYISQIGFTHEIRRNKIMKTFDLLLSSINDVKDFVNIVSKYDFDVDLTSGRYVVDAKSIMGIFSLDLSKPIDLNIHAENDIDTILAVLKPYIV